MFLLFLFSPLVHSQNLNNKQRRLSLINLQKTLTGQELLSPFHSFEDAIAHITFGDTPSNRLYVLLTEKEEGVEGRLRLNGHLLAASPVYNSWILAMSMVEHHIYLILKKHGLSHLPYRFPEYSQWSFILAMRHWEELGHPNQYDYAKHPSAPIRKFPLSLQASVTFWDSLWHKDLRSFLKAVKKRHLDLGFDSITLSQYIFQAPPQKAAAARELRKAFQDLVFDECQRRTPNQCVRP
ncbi:MAG: hypothetical protein D6797_03355 [Bdellovibrio sp.]|nr:MAG: hypothetical protein D6797_03355 [Bdellovibrio sp.]